ncbi:MAG: sulfate adenylyltransferase [Deltaproteobacteria bacterium]|nr:sulfate adenylyltransferase [Deltaproteobacteria bacterium]
MTGLIAPHGGTLIKRALEGKEREEAAKRAEGLKTLKLTEREISDLEMIAIGGFSPLEGFMCKEDYHGVMDTMTLKNGLPWTIPVTLSTDKATGDSISVGEEVALTDGSGKVLGLIEVQEIFNHDKEKESLKVYGTTEDAHPGVAKVLEMGDTLIGGKISVIERPEHNDFGDERLDPEETRKLFKEKGWKRVVGFQTRNPIHRAHEYIQKCALETVDGLMIHPLVGETKAGDISATVRMDCYKALMDNYYPADRVALVVFPAAMRYAGPREAVFHALIRKNYGCTHFIVGRDHAGVGNYYGTFDAHFIFDEFDPAAIDISPMFFDYTFFCKKCGGMASFKSCPHDSEHHISLSGTKVREMLLNGEKPPAEFSRPEVAEILIKAMSK